MPPVIVNATAGRHTATVIFLHGLGDSGHGWSSAFQAIRKPHVKYVCPTAAPMPVSLNGGFRMSSWFDILGLEENSAEDQQGIRDAADLLQQYISEEEKAGIPRKRIMVGGFSQGGAVALYSSLAYEKQKAEPLAGVIGLSCWMPLHKQFNGIKVNTETPVFQGHGETDPLVKFSFGKLTAEAISKFNKNHVFKSYQGMGHSSCEQEMSDVRDFIDKHLPDTQ